MTFKASTIRRLTLAAALLAGGQAMAQQTAGEVEQGHAAFVGKGCYECHGLAGQGAKGVAPPIARSRLPEAAFQAYVRKPGGQMPPYSAKLVPDPELRSIYAYLQSLPAPRSASTIPLLAGYVVATPPAQVKARGVAGAGAAPAGPSVAEGAAVYSQNCAACHGAELQGGRRPRPERRGRPEDGRGDRCLRQEPRAAHAQAAPGRPRPAGRGRLHPFPQELGSKGFPSPLRAGLQHMNFPSPLEGEWSGVGVHRRRKLA